MCDHCNLNGRRVKRKGGGTRENAGRKRNIPSTTSSTTITAANSVNVSVAAPSVHNVAAVRPSNDSNHNSDTFAMTIAPSVNNNNLDSNSSATTTTASNTTSVSIIYSSTQLHNN